MTPSKRRFAMQLALTPGIGGKSLQRILFRSEVLGQSPAEFFGLSEAALREEFGLRPKAASAIAGMSAEQRQSAERLADRLESYGVFIVTSADAQYPKKLEEFDPDCPPLLFMYGNQRLLQAKTFCVLCSNGAPPSAIDAIEAVTERGVLGSEVLVSGANRPAYQRAAVVPLRWGSPRVLCLDRGVFQSLGSTLSQEPFPAARLWRYRFDKETDLVVSPVRPAQSFRGTANQVRDRLVAGLADRLDCVWIKPGGNMEAIVRLGLKAGRQVRISRASPDADALEAMGAQTLTH